MKPNKLFAPIYSIGMSIDRFRMISVCIALFACSFISAQENAINGVDVTGCGGFLVDTGASAADYGNNENETITLCAQAPETILNLYWTVCDLGNGDYIEIFDGPSTAYTLIGTYYSSDLQSLDITSTNINGCLTVHFVSDNSEIGNFGAEISCGLPCIRPISSVTSNQDPMPVYICPGDEVTFDGSGTQFFNGGTLASFTWNFDDGSTSNTGWPAINHTFNEPGGYKVQLSVTDNNGCTNTNLNDYLIFVSTYPNFNLITDITDLCSGGQAFLGVTNIAQDSLVSNDSLSNWISEPWTDLPNNYNEDGYQVEDDQSQCYDVYFTYNDFPPGETVDQLSDIVSAYINFEHSFMQDLVISLICPNGQSMILHQQVGGGTDVGEAVVGTDGIPGVGYDYFWSPNATNGTWGDNADFTALPAGTYESTQPFTNLLGCPLNGTWNFEFCDMWGGDDGFLFNYGMNFNPNLYDETLSFLPVYGPGCDSTFWTGSGIVDQSSGCDYVNVELTAPGTYQYVYTAINDFGCSFDTTITISVDVAPTVNAGPDITFDCLNPTMLLDGFLNEYPEASCSDDGGIFNYTYQNNDNLSWTFCPDAGSESSTLMTFSFTSGQMEVGFEDLYVYDGIDNNAPVLLEWDEGDATGLSFVATNSTGCLTIEFTSDGSISAADGTYAAWTYEVGCEQIEPDYVYSWTPAQYLDSPDQATTSVSGLTNTQTFTFTGYPAGQPNCFSTDEATIFVSSNLEIDVEEFYQECPGDSAEVLAPQIVGGVAPFEIKWVAETGEEFLQDTIRIPVGALKMYCAIVEDACGLTDTACTEISAFPAISANFNVDEPFGCDPHTVLMTSDFVEFQNIQSMRWNYGDGEIGGTLASANHAYTEEGTFYPSLEIVDINGCIYSDTMDSPVIVWPTPIARFFAEPEVAVLPVTTFDFENTSANASTYHWTFDVFGESDTSDTTWTFPSETAGQYLISLFATNQYGCIDTVSKYVYVQDEIDLYIPNSFTPDYDGINDVWRIEGSGFETKAYQLVIFNRWGEKMFETDDPYAVWTGNFAGGGSFVPDGVYLYRIQIRDKENEVGHVYEGHITIVR